MLLEEDYKMKHFFGNMTKKMIEGLFQLHRQVITTTHYTVKANEASVVDQADENVFLQDFEMFGYQYDPSAYFKYAKDHQED